jgi:biotin carboxyl carrier protein
VAVSELDDGRLRVEIEGASGSTSIDVMLFGNAEVLAAIGRNVFELRATGAGITVGSERLPVWVESREHRDRSAGRTRAGSGIVRAPMPGRVVKVLVEPGARVEQGAGVVVVEAMKMENELSAPVSGSVERVLVTAGDAVERGAALVEIR